MKSMHAFLPPIPISAIANFSDLMMALISTPGFLPIDGAGLRVAEPVSVDIVVALPTLPPPYPDFPPMRCRCPPSTPPPPTVNSTAEPLNRNAEGAALAVVPERIQLGLRQAWTQVAEALPGIHKNLP